MTGHRRKGKTASEQPISDTLCVFILEIMSDAKFVKSSRGLENSAFVIKKISAIFVIFIIFRSFRNLRNVRNFRKFS